jgi:hypothetical protein
MSDYRSIRIAFIATFSFVAIATGGSAQPTPQQQRDGAMQQLQKSSDDINKFLQQNGQSAYILSGPPTFNADFQARNPRVCSKLTTPPTPEQAKALVQCAEESLTNGLTPLLMLVTDLQVEMGSPHAFQMGINSANDVDTSAMVYPLRGQGTTWACNLARLQPGQNCQRDRGVPKGVGECWHTQFGDWRCEMTTGGAGWETRLKGPTGY